MTTNEQIRPVTPTFEEMPVRLGLRIPKSLYRALRRYAGEEGVSINAAAILAFEQATTDKQSISQTKP